MANLSSFDLNLLRVLDALLHCNSTVGAAKVLNLSQPAVSGALARLRGALGDELFFRRGQSLEPTQYALSLKEPLTAILGDVEVLIRDRAAFDPAASTDTFRISGSDFFAEMLMPQLADRFSEIAPQIRVHLVDLVPDSYVDTLERYEVDLALIPATTLPDWVDHQLVFRSTFSVVARKGHPRLQRNGVKPGDVVPLDLFCDLGHVLFSPEGNHRAMGDAALARVGRERRVVMTMPVFSGVYRAVANSDLIALLPSELAHHIAPFAGLEVFDVPVKVDTVDILMVWHHRYSASPAHRWLRDQITDALSPLNRD